MFERLTLAICLPIGVYGSSGRFPTRHLDITTTKDDLRISISGGDVQTCEKGYLSLHRSIYPRSTNQANANNCTDYLS